MSTATHAAVSAAASAERARSDGPRGRHTWEILDLFPRQGEWTVDDYLALDADRLVELTDGVLEVLPMPDGVHQDVALWIATVVSTLIEKRGRGSARIAPFPVRVHKRRYREPDVCVLLDERDPRFGRRFWRGADIAVEVVSPGYAERDYVKKRRDYARAGVAEYWIVDPRRATVRLLALDGKRYRVVGTYRAGDLPRSSVLDGWEFNVAKCLEIAARADGPEAAD